MPILFFSEKGRPGAALFRSLSQAPQYATLLPAVYSSTSLFSSNTEHLLQVGNSHLMHLYLVPMPWGNRNNYHISTTLCDVGHDFEHSQDLFRHSVPRRRALRLVSTKRNCHGGPRMHSRPGREIFFVQRMLARGGNSV